jgi:hypothetical protein
MLRHKPWERPEILAFFALTCAVPVSSAAADAKSFESTRYGYTVRYPCDWHLQGRAGTFMIENFPPYKAVRGVRLPPGGAAIVIGVPSPTGRGTLPQSLDDWVKQAIGHQEVLVRRELPLGDGHRVIPITEIQAYWRNGDTTQQYTEWFFRMDGRYFQVSLVYWQGDPNARKLEETLKEIVFSLRVR